MRIRTAVDISTIIRSSSGELSGQSESSTHAGSLSTISRSCYGQRLVRATRQGVDACGLAQYTFWILLWRTPRRSYTAGCRRMRIRPAVNICTILRSRSGEQSRRRNSTMHTGSFSTICVSCCDGCLAGATQQVSTHAGSLSTIIRSAITNVLAELHGRCRGMGVRSVLSLNPVMTNVSELHGRELTHADSLSRQYQPYPRVLRW